MKNKKDILILCQFFYPEYVSSATLPFDTAVALSKAGFSVSAICGYPKEYNLTNEVQIKETYEEIEIRRLKYVQLKRTTIVGRLINYFSFTFAGLLRINELRRYESIIVYSNPPVLPLLAVLVKKLFNTKVVFVSYDIYPEIAIKTNIIRDKSFISRIMKITNKMLYKNVSKVVALSNEMKEYILKNRSGISDWQVEVIPNWYEDRLEPNIENSSENKLFYPIKKDENFVVSYFGNMGVCQDLDTIVNAIIQLRGDNSVQFIFAGHGNKIELLKTVAKKEKLDNLTIFNFLHGQDFQDALKISDCFLVSLADGLTGLAVPSKTYSYMMAGKPIIAIIGENSDIARDLKDNHAGYAIEIRDSYRLVNSIVELRDNKDKRRQIGENCRKVFLEKYTKEKCTQKYVNLMKELLGE